MKIINGDIWEIHEKLINKETEKVIFVVPTNLGWKKDGSNVMGRGLAKQVKEKFSYIPIIYGSFCFQLEKGVYDNSISFIEAGQEDEFLFLMFPTKPLNKDFPHLSWKQNSTLETIENSCKDFIKKYDKNTIYLFPMVGCGNGQLKESEVIPILEKYFSNKDNIILVKQGN